MAHLKTKILGLAVAAATVLAPATAQAELIPIASLVNGVAISQSQCAAQRTAVWVTVGNKGYCIRYYLSTAGGQGNAPVVYISGDKIGSYRARTKQFVDVDKDPIDTDDIQRGTDRISKEAKTTALHIGRPGLDGSSGFHGYRGTWLELYILNAALEEIKRKHGFMRYNLIGQSGGSSMVAGLVILRSDIACAIAGAGHLAGVDKPKGGDRMMHQVDASRDIARIASRRETRFILITDPKDTRVTVAMQTPFVTELRRAGGRAEQYYVRATDNLRHGVRSYSERAVVGCMNNETHEQMHASLMEVQARKVAVVQNKNQPQQPTQARQPAAQPQQPSQAQPSPRPQGPVASPRPQGPPAQPARPQGPQPVQQPVQAQIPAPPPAKQYAGRIQPIPVAQQSPQDVSRIKRAPGQQNSGRIQPQPRA